MKKSGKSFLVQLYLKNKKNLFITVDYILMIISCITPKKKLILLESKPDYSDNTYEIYKAMIENGLNKKYRIIWLIDDPLNNNHFKAENEASYEIHPKTIAQKIYLRYLMNRATCIVCSHRFIFPYFKRKKQVFVYLDHGSPLKDCKEVFLNSENRNAYYINKSYYIAQSDFFVDAIIDQYGITRDKIISLGLPRNDQLFKKYKSLNRIISAIDKYDKVLIWAPTFRYHVSKTRVDCHSYMPLGIPICYSEEDYFKLNRFLEDHNILLLLKPHPAQNIDMIVNTHCSNICILDNDELKKYNIQTNELLAQTDALITDYSSIYYDYLLLNKPIGITLDDYEQYKEEMGFVFANPLEVIKGSYIYNIDDLCDFITSIAMNQDEFREIRSHITKLIDKYHDCYSSNRVFEFIISKID